PVFHTGGSAGRPLFAALLPTREELLGKEGLQDGSRVAAACSPHGPALPGGAVLPGAVQVLQRRFRSSRAVVSAGVGGGSLKRSAEQPGCGASAAQQPIGGDRQFSEGPGGGQRRSGLPFQPGLYALADGAVRA